MDEADFEIANVEIHPLFPGRMVSYSLLTGETDERERPFGWRVTYDLVGAQGEEVAEDLNLWPLGGITPPGGLTRRVLRSVTLEAHQPEKSGDDQSPWVLQSAAGFPPVQPGRRGPGGGHNDMFLAQIAYAYVSAVERGSRQPIADVSALLRQLDIALANESIRGLVNRARKRGLLTAPPKKGVAGGRLTDAAWNLLKEFGIRPTGEADA